MEKNEKKVVIMVIIMIICMIVIGTLLFFTVHYSMTQEKGITVQADEKQKEYKWDRKIVDEGTVIGAEYLWPDELNPRFTAIYHDGDKLQENEMVTVMSGAPYHFRGLSDDSILYTEVYVGNKNSDDITSGETGIWYNLLPSAVRNNFENSGWTWESGWDYTGRAYLDAENQRIMIKDDDPTAVLYGIGLFLDNKYDYATNASFTQEGDIFRSSFGHADNLFALALECYYTRSGELRSTCPAIYALVSEALAQLNTVVVEAPSEPDIDISNGPVLVTDLVGYVNTKRAENHLASVSWDEADDENIKSRISEFSQIQSGESRAFPDNVYTDAVMCEVFIQNAFSLQDIYSGCESYFLMENLQSFNCIIDNGKGIVVFVW